MNIVTHALLPALLAAPALPQRGRKEFYRAAGIVALGGALPDLLNPHLSLAARCASWSHTIFAVGGLGAVLTALRLLEPGWLSWKMAVFVWLAYDLHLFGDAVSGGIALFRPISTYIVGPRPRWIPYRWWWWCDLAMVIAWIGVIVALAPKFDRRDARPDK